MKKLTILAAAVWMTAGAAYAAGFEQELSVNTKGLKSAAAKSNADVPQAKQDKTADPGIGYELVCAPFGDGLSDVILNAKSITVTPPSGRSEVYFFDKDTPFVLDTPVSVFLAKRGDSQQFMGAWDKAVLFGITGYGPGLNVSAQLAMKGVVYPLKCQRRW